MTNVPVPRNWSGSAAVEPACSVSKDSFVFSTPGERCHSKDELQFSYTKNTVNEYPRIAFPVVSLD